MLCLSVLAVVLATAALAIADDPACELARDDTRRGDGRGKVVVIADYRQSIRVE